MASCVDRNVQDDHAASGFSGFSWLNCLTLVGPRQAGRAALAGSQHFLALLERVVDQVADHASDLGGVLDQVAHGPHRVHDGTRRVCELAPAAVRTGLPSASNDVQVDVVATQVARAAGHHRVIACDAGRGAPGGTYVRGAESTVYGAGLPFVSDANGQGAERFVPEDEAGLDESNQHLVGIYCAGRPVRLAPVNKINEAKTWSLKQWKVFSN